MQKMLDWPFFEGGYIAGARRVLRLHNPGDWWLCLPDRPITPHGLLFWNVPPHAYVLPRIHGTPIADVRAPVPAKMFDAGGAVIQLNTLIDWPTVDSASGLELELRSRDGELITNATHPDVEGALYGVQLRR